MQSEMIQTENQTKIGQPIQDPFLNALRKQRVPVSIYLSNGIKLQGIVSGFDSTVILLKNNAKQMIYKHSVATVVPTRNIVWHDVDGGMTDTQPLLDDQEPLENY